MHVFDRTFMQEPGSRGSGSPALYTTQILSRVRLLRLIPWKSVPIAPRNLQPCASRLQPYASPGGACPIAPRLLMHWLHPLLRGAAASSAWGWGLAVQSWCVGSGACSWPSRRGWHRGPCPHTPRKHQSSRAASAPPHAAATAARGTSGGRRAPADGREVRRASVEEWRSGLGAEGFSVDNRGR